MTIQIALNPETEARLRAEARAKGLAIEKLAEQLLDQAATMIVPSRAALSVEDFQQLLVALAEGSESLPDLPTSSFSRESFYEERSDGADAIPPR